MACLQGVVCRDRRSLQSDRRPRCNSSPRHLSAKHPVEINWFAVHSAGGLQADSPMLAKYFDVKPYPSIYNRHSIPSKLRIVPHLLVPRDGFHRLATSAIGIPEVARAPYQGLHWAGDLDGDITSIRSLLFPGDVMITRIAARLTHPVANDMRPLLADLQAHRSLKRVAALEVLVGRVASLAHGIRRAEAPPVGYDTYFMMSVRVSQSPDLFDSGMDQVKSELVALLIGTENAELLRDDVVQRVWDASEELNAKAAHELMLLNRLGLLHIVPNGPYRGPHLHRFENTRDLVTLALYAKHLLRDEAAYASNNPREARALIKKVEQWIVYPRLTFDVSVSHTLTWAALSEQLLLEDRVDAWFRYLEGFDLQFEGLWRQDS